MSRTALTFIGVIALALSPSTGCGELDGTPGAIEDAFADNCELDVTHEDRESDELGYARFGELADQELLIKCEESLGNAAVYARFASRDKLRAAFRSLELPPGRVEQYCIARTESFRPISFGGARRICAEAGGEITVLKGPPKP